MWTFHPLILAPLVTKLPPLRWGRASGDPSKGRRDCTLPCLFPTHPRPPVDAQFEPLGARWVARVTIVLGKLKWGVCTGDSLLFRRAGRHLRWWVTPALRASNREGAGATRPPSRYPGRIGETRAFFGWVPGSGEIGSCNNDPVAHARAPARFCHVNGPYSPVL